MAKKKQDTTTPEVEVKEVRAVAKYVRTAPRKLRLVADMIRGRKANEARDILNFTPKRAAKTLLKVLESAMANAENNSNLDKDRLTISRTFVDQGPAIKRFIPRSRGRASSVLKYSSHITVVLRQNVEGI